MEYVAKPVRVSMKQITFPFSMTICLVMMFSLSTTVTWSKHQFVTNPVSRTDLPQSLLQVARERAARLVRGTTEFPGGRSSALVVQPVIRLEGDTLPGETRPGRAVRSAGELIIEFRAPGEFALLGSVSLPFQGKGSNAEMALLDGLMMMEADQDKILAAYGEAYAIQEIKWNDCSRFLATCQELADRNKWPEALLTLGSSPPGTPCSREAEDLWKDWSERRKEQRCTDLVKAARAAREQQDDHRLLIISVAADRTCQPSFWKEVADGLRSRITEESKADYRLLGRLAEDQLHPDDPSSCLLALLFEQVMNEQTDNTKK